MTEVAERPPLELPKGLKPTPLKQVQGEKPIIKHGTPPGDFEQRTPEQRVAILNNVVHHYVSALGREAGYEEKDPNNPDYVAMYDAIKKNPPERYAAKVAELENDLKETREFFDKPEIAEELEKVAQKYKMAEEKLLPLLENGTITLPDEVKTSPYYTQAIAQMAARLATFGETQEIEGMSDFDKTISSLPDEYLLTVPGGEITETIAENEGHDALLKLYALTQQDIAEQAPELFYAEGQTNNRGIREGVNEFFSGLIGKHKVHYTVATASPEMSVVGAVEAASENVRNGIAPVDVFGVQLDKSNIVKLLALKGPVFVAGDGSSDISTIDAKDYMIGAFALENASFAKALGKNNVPHTTWKNFHDIKSQMSLVTKVADIFRPHLATAA